MAGAPRRHVVNIATGQVGFEDWTEAEVADRDRLAAQLAADEARIADVKAARQLLRQKAKTAGKTSDLGVMARALGLDLDAP